MEALTAHAHMHMHPHSLTHMHPHTLSHTKGKHMENIEALTMQLDPSFEVDEMLLMPHPFMLSITEGGGEVSLSLSLSLSVCVDEMLLIRIPSCSLSLAHQLSHSRTLLLSFPVHARRRIRMLQRKRLQNC